MGAGPYSTKKRTPCQDSEIYPPEASERHTVRGGYGCVPVCRLALSSSIHVSKSRRYKAPEVGSQEFNSYRRLTDMLKVL